MSAAKKIWNADEFALKFEGQNVELASGQIHAMPPAKTKQGQAQATFAGILMRRFHRISPKSKLPGGWWFVVESPVKYGMLNLFCHDMAGWKRSRSPKNPAEDYPVALTPDWVCEILSTNIRDDKVKKQDVLHEWRVPYYWLVDSENQEIRILEWEEDEYKAVLDADTSYVGPMPPFQDVELSVKMLFGLEDDND